MPERSGKPLHLSILQLSRLKSTTNRSVWFRYHAPHEKVPMHSHKDGVVVYLTELREISTESDGTSRQITRHAGDVIWSPAHTHSLENLADTPIEVIEIELKSAPNSSLHSHSRSRSHKRTANVSNVSLAKRR